MANPNSSAQRSFAAEPYDSVAAVLASKQITAVLAGQRVHTKDGYTYHIPEDQSITDWHVQTAGGAKMYVVPSHGALSVAAFNIRPDGSDYTDEIIAADRAAKELGVTLFWPDCKWQTGEYYAMRGPIRRTASWASNWNAAEIRCIGVTSGAAGFFQHGNVSYSPLASLPVWGTLNAWSAGDNELTGVSFAASLTPGDLVWIEAGPSYATSGHYVPTYGLINEVVSVNGSTIQLKHAMDEAGTSDMRIFRFDQTDTGMFCAHGADLYGLRLWTNLSGCVFERGGGSYEMNVNIPYFKGDSFVFGNAYMRSVYHADEAEVVRHLAEMAYCSFNSHVSVNRSIIIALSATKNPMRTFSENCRDCSFEAKGIVEVPYLTTITTDNNDALVFQTDCRRCRMTLSGINAPLFTGTILLWWNYPRSSVVMLSDNIFSLGDVYAPEATTRCAQFRDSGGGWLRNTLKDTRFFCDKVTSQGAILYTGNVVEPVLQNITLSAGGLNIAAGIDPVIENVYAPLGFASTDQSAVFRAVGIKKNASKSAREAVQQQFRAGAQTITSTTPGNAIQTATFPSGSLKAWTDLEFDISGVFSESSGTTNQTKTVIVLFGGTEVARAAATQNGAINIQGRVRVLSDTLVTATGSVTVGNTTTAFAVSISALPSMSANPTVFEMQAFVSGTAATIPLRQRTLRVRHPDEGR